METFDVNKADKVVGFQDFINGIRDKSGGIIMSLIIPPTYKDLMLNPKLEEKTEGDFYLYGWYNHVGFPIYVDNALTDDIYIVCNLWSNKIKVAVNG